MGAGRLESRSRKIRMIKDDRFMIYVLRSGGARDAPTKSSGFVRIPPGHFLTSFSAINFRPSIFYWVFDHLGTQNWAKMNSFSALVGSEIDEKSESIFRRRKNRPRDQKLWDFGPLGPSTSWKNDSKTKQKWKIAFLAPSVPSDRKNTKNEPNMSSKWSSKLTKKH